MQFGVTISAKDDPGSMGGVEKATNYLNRAICARDSGFELVGLGTGFSFGPASTDERGEAPTTWQLQPMLVLAHVAAHLGTDVKYATKMLLSSSLHPVQLAEDLATLDALCIGRLRVGIALGWRPYELEAFGIERSTRVKRFEELLIVLRALLTCDAVTFEGEFFRVKDAMLFARSVQQPCPPLWLGASVDSAVKRAAQLGDSWCPSPHHSVSELISQTAVYRDELAKLGRPMPEERPIVRNIFMSADREAALEEAMPTYAEVYRRRRAAGAPELATMDASEVGELPCIVGNPDDCIEQISKIREALGVNVMFLGMPHGKSPEARLRAIELLGTEVLPHFRASGS